MKLSCNVLLQNYGVTLNFESRLIFRELKALECRLLSAENPNITKTRLLYSRKKWPVYPIDPIAAMLEFVLHFMISGTCSVTRWNWEYFYSAITLVIIRTLLVNSISLTINIIVYVAFSNSIIKISAMFSFSIIFKGWFLIFHNKI